LEQIFLKLKRDNIVKSIRGSSGGYILNKEPEQITLSNIFSAVDEKIKTLQCNRESKKGCNGKLTKCITHYLWDDLEFHINDFFDKKNLADLLKNNQERRI
jgi:Rrf2 family iron-sulfur cluster assembly transcriptional regulator